MYPANKARFSFLDFIHELAEFWLDFTIIRVFSESGLSLRYSYTQISCAIYPRICLYMTRKQQKREYITRQKLCLHKQQQQPYILTGLKKCCRSTRARVERTMMVVHIVSRAQHPAATETTGSTQTSQCFVSHSLSLPAWISNMGGISQSQIRKDDMVHYHSRAPPRIYCDVCVLWFRYL